MAHCDRGGLDKIEATDGPKLISLYVFEILWLKKKSVVNSPLLSLQVLRLKAALAKLDNNYAIQDEKETCMTLIYIEVPCFIIVWWKYVIGYY